MIQLNDTVKKTDGSLFGKERLAVVVGITGAEVRVRFCGKERSYFAPDLTTVLTAADKSVNHRTGLPNWVK